MKQLTIAGVNVNALTKEDLVEITPDMARKYLQKDNNNIRRVSTAEVNKYCFIIVVYKLFDLIFIGNRVLK